MELTYITSEKAGNFLSHGRQLPTPAAPPLLPWAWRRRGWGAGVVEAEGLLQAGSGLPCGQVRAALRWCEPMSPGLWIVLMAPAELWLVSKLV